MRELKNIAPIFLFVIAQFMYDNLAPLRSTNWSIFYFSMQYLSFALISFNLAQRNSFKKNLPYYVLSSGFAIYVIRNVIKINMNYNDFMLSINNFEADLLLNLYIIVSLIIVLICRK